MANREWKLKQPAPYGRCACGMPLSYWQAQFSMTVCDECDYKKEKEREGT